MKIMKLTQKESYWSSVALYIHLSYGGNVCSILINVDDLLLNVSMLAKHYGIFIRNSLASCQSMKHCVFENIWVYVTSLCLSHLEQRWITHLIGAGCQRHQIVVGFNDVMSQQMFGGWIENTLSSDEAGLLCMETSSMEQIMVLGSVIFRHITFLGNKKHL